ncbi:unnamed protein product [Xylocopa violacea]|uniref:MYCBP-associated protein n=1 Tax=Xylocopa violacea TaxID=135666 RepID=A0ABP1NAE7_XYLVO
MDYARKIGKSDEPKKWTRQPPTFVTTRDRLISPEVVSNEDRRLENWKTWLERRKKQQEHTESVTGRPPSEQILNSCETVRPLVEMRNLIDYASVPVPVVPDKYRGGPEFWRTPRTLPKRGIPCSFPDITFTPSKKELNIAPELLYVHLPELLEKEKGLVDPRPKEPLWKRSQYLMKRRKELSKEIALLIPKEPETKDLVIKNHVPFKPEVLPRIPPITISRVEDEEEKSHCGYYPEQVVVLKIQEREIVWQKSDSSKCDAETEPTMWSLTFSGTVNKRMEKEIVFENKGNRVIVYQWRNTVLHSDALPLPIRMSPFFFNKTKGVILPGQIVKLQVWYLPRRSCIVTEFWRLVTSPILCPSQLIFRFWGCARTSKKDERSRLESIRTIDRYLDRCVSNSVAWEIMDDIVDSIISFKRPQVAYGNLFLESELFIVKNPLCFYSPSILTEFHKIYYNATNQNELRWDMSLDDLRDALLRIKQSERRDNMLSRFNSLYKECLKPTLYSAVQYKKHEAVYNLLCSFFNLFEVESESAKNACFVKEREDASDMASEISCAMSMYESQVSVKTSRRKLERKLSSCSEECSVKKVGDDAVFASYVLLSPYREIFFIRIYQLLGDTMVQVFASIESFNNLNERDK